MTEEKENLARRWLPTIVGIISFLFISISAVATMSANFARMDERIIQVTAQTVRNKEHISALEVETKAFDSVFATIMEKLSNIEKALNNK